MRSRLQIQKISKSYKKKPVIKDVCFEIHQGEILGLLGPNGAGKTTTFYMVVGLLFPDAGCIYYDRTDITSFSMYQRARMGISYLAQESSIFKKLTVEENIFAILELQNKDKVWREERLNELLEEFDILRIRHMKGFSLSGGERRRTEIARALASEPSFLLLDEPFAGVDPIAVQEINRIILRLKSKNIGVLITDHNARETLRITDRSCILTAGTIRFAGSPQELSQNQLVKQVYLGDDFVL